MVSVSPYSVNHKFIVCNMFQIFFFLEVETFYFVTEKHSVYMWHLMDLHHHSVTLNEHF